MNVQIVGKWHAERTILHIASLLEVFSPVKGSHPSLQKCKRPREVSGGLVNSSSK